MENKHSFAALLLPAMILVGASWFSGPAQAFYMEFVRDLISNSAPSASSTHVLQFRSSSTLPAGSKVIVYFPSEFELPSGLALEDIDFATSSAMNGTFVNRSLAGTATAGADGVSVTTGFGGSITITLNSTQGIAAGTHMKLTVGTNASFELAGDTDILNASTTGSYRVSFETRTAGGGLLDEATTFVTVIAPVAMAADTNDFDAPIITNALPSGTIPAGIRNVEISFNTNEPATCKYATSSGLTYAQMPNSFPMVLETFHYTVVDTPADSTFYPHYIICRDFVPNFTNPLLLSFTVAAPLPPPSTGGGSGGQGGGGVAGGNQFPAEPLAPQITLSGKTFPGGTVTVLKDNLAFKETTAGNDGSFQTTATDLPQGTYTFSIYARDSAGTRTSSYSTTLTIISGTRNVVSGIFLSPSVKVEKDTLAAAEPAELSGFSVPGSAVQLQVIPQKKGAITDAEIVRQTVQAGTSGAWNFSLSTAALALNTYEVRAKATHDTLGTSPLSQAAYFGLGRGPSPDFCRRSDLNTDSKVNLVDFSILLFHWNSTNPLADINLDGKVNLVDFSVQLFCWTG
jgi:hypothetical protein